MLPLAAEPTQAPLSHRLTQKLHESFSGARTFFEDVLVFLVLAAPYILGVIVVVVAGSWIYSAIRNRKEKKKKENNP